MRVEAGIPNDWSSIDVLDHGNVEPISICATDEMVLKAMLVSTGKDNELLATMLSEDFHDEEASEIVKRNKGRINFLLKSKPPHTSPFEHNMFTFRIKAPIFVLREWHRHRIGWSYNELSGRYTKLPEEYYIPHSSNVRRRVGKPGAYTYEGVRDDQAYRFIDALEKVCRDGYLYYTQALTEGYAPEQARMFLHVNHYTVMYATCNAHSLMHFLKLRNHASAQWEIQQYASALENYFAAAMPVTYEAFVNDGRLL